MAEKGTKNQETVDLVKDLIKDVKVAMMTTVSGDELVSRPMRTQEIEFDGDLWFLTKKDTDKFKEISENPMINLAYVDKSYVSLSGNAEIIQDEARKKEYWNPILGRVLETSVDDPDVVLIKVSPVKAEYWESGLNMKTVKEFTKKIVKKSSMQEGNDLKQTVYFDENNK